MKEILLSSSVLIAATVLLRFVFRRAISRRAQYALWLPVLLRLLGEDARIPYGEALLALVPRGPGRSLLSATAMAAGKRQMRDRIRRIAGYRRPLVFALVPALLLTGAACAVTFPGAQTAPAGPSEAVAVFSRLFSENALFYSEDGGIWGLDHHMKQGEGEPERVAATRCGPVFLPETTDVGETLKLHITGIHESTPDYAKQPRWWYLDYTVEQADKKPKVLTLSLQIRLDGRWYVLPSGGLNPDWTPSEPDSMCLMKGRFYPEETEQIIPGHYRLVVFRDWRGALALDAEEFDLVETADGCAVENIRKPDGLFGEAAYVPGESILRQDGSRWLLAEADTQNLWPHVTDTLEAG